MKIYGLTGGIGAGKSAVAQRFRALGVPVIDADKVGHEAIAPGGPAERPVIDAFGEDILDCGKISREKLARRVFNDPDARRRLNAIVHPAIIAETARRTARLAEEGHDAAIIEAALLAEDGVLREGFDGLIVVDCPEDIRIRRLVEQRGMTEDEARRRVRSQAPPKNKLRLATWVIDNSKDLEHLYQQVDRIRKEL